MDKLIRLGLAKELLQGFVRGHVDAIHLLDTNLNVLYVNPAFEGLYGWAYEELIGKPLPIIPDILLHETIRRSKDGCLIDVAITFSPILNDQHEIVAISGISRDISHRKKIEQKLEESYTRFYELFHHATDIILIYELNDEGQFSHFIEVNQTACQKLGYSKSELLALSPGQVSDDSHLLHRSDLLTEWSLIPKTGGKIPVEVTVSKIPWNNKSVLLAVARDITERKKNEELLRRSDKLAVAGELAAGVAHEIRNPLTSLKGFIQLFSSNVMDNRYQDFCHIMLSEIDRINLIVSELLLLTKPKSLQLQKEAITPIVGQTVMLMKAQANLQSMQILTDYYPENLIVNCDPNKLKQVFVNLLKNAIEASPSGGRILVQTAKTNDQRIIISFTDYGRGISKENLEKIGQSFFTTKEKGTGLGLMICHKIVEEHKGVIQFFSQCGKGTTVSVALPLEEIGDVPF
jgi:two-component system, sporulation sensor kinase A